MFFSWLWGSVITPAPCAGKHFVISSPSQAWHLWPQTLQRQSAALCTPVLCITQRLPTHSTPSPLGMFNPCSTPKKNSLKNQIKSERIFIIGRLQDLHSPIWEQEDSRGHAILTQLQSQGRSGSAVRVPAAAQMLFLNCTSPPMGS